MTKIDSPPKRKPARRGKGRPVRGDGAVGREAVVAAVRQLLKRMPPEKITRADLSREAGIDPGLVRYYFGNMSSLLGEVMLDLFEELQKRRSGSTGDGSLRARLRRRIGALIEILEENPHLHKMLVDRVVFGSGADVEALRSDYTGRSVADLKAIIAEAQQLGEAGAVDVEFLYMAIIGACEFAVTSFPLFEQLLGGGLDRHALLGRYADFLTGLIVDGLAARPEPVRP